MAVSVPLVEDLLLNLLVTADKVVEGFDVWFGAVGRKGQIVVLEVETHTREVHFWLNSDVLELLWVACGTPNGKFIETGSAEEESSCDLPIPERCRMRGELSVPPLTTICLRALKTLASFSPCERALVGMVRTPTALLLSSRTILSHLALHTRCRLL